MGAIIGRSKDKSSDQDATDSGKDMPKDQTDRAKVSDDESRLQRSTQQENQEDLEYK